jgi:hypothetical protein
MEGNLSGAVCSMCRQWMAASAGWLEPKDAIAVFADAFQVHVQSAHPDDVPAE